MYSLTRDRIYKLIPPIFEAYKDEFGKCTTNQERIDFFTRTNLDILNIKEWMFMLCVKKDDDEAIKKRETGNNFFKEKNYIRAIEYYTYSVMWSETKTVASMAYGNRSAALARMDLNEECLIDIERAFEHDYPKRLKPKLIARKEDVVGKKNTARAMGAGRITISADNQNGLIQSASNCIEIKSSEKYGRHITATRDIAIGELLVVEKPFVSGLLQSYYLRRCQECLTVCYNMIPCENCPRVAYCSKTCKERDFQNCHKYECLVLLCFDAFDYALRWEMTAALKLTLCALNKSETVVGNFNYRSDRSDEINKLIVHTNELPPIKLFAMSSVSNMMLHVIKAKTNLFDNNCFEERFKELYLLHLQIIDVNAMAVTHLNEPVGWAVYSLSSLFNHSCYPNTFYYSDRNAVVVRAIATIKKGEQCFIPYQASYDDDAKPIRQERISNKYYFICTCPACEQNWPVDGKTREITLPHTPNNLKKHIHYLKRIEATAPNPKVNTLRKFIEQCYYLNVEDPNFF